MAKWLFVVESNSADRAREAEFSEWYDKIHVPDVLETPGFIRAARYENTKPSTWKAKYLATYEFEADDSYSVMKTLDANLAKKKAEGRWSDLLLVTAWGVYKQISSFDK